jgi:TolB-like protein
MWWRNSHSVSCNRNFLIAGVLLLYAGSLFAQEAVDQFQPESIAVAPIIARDAPRYSALLLTKLVQENFRRTEVFTPTVLSEESLAGMSADFDPQKITARLTELGNQQGTRYVAAGTVTKRGAQYQIKMVVVDSEQGRRVLSTEQTAVGLEDVDRAVMDITDELIAAEFPAAVQEKVRKIRQAESAEDAELREDLADLEKIAEEDPEEAIKRLPEKVQKAVAEKAKEQAKDEAREEVVQEEIQTLYEEEKEQKRIARARKIQKYSLYGLYGLRFLGDVFDTVSVQTRMQEAQYWSAYMVEPHGFYDQYRYFNRRLRPQVSVGYVLGGLSSNGLGAAHLLYYPDIITVSETGRKVLAVSQAAYTLGAIGTMTAGLFGIDSMVGFTDYYTTERASVGQTGIDKAYDDYREEHLYYHWTQIGAYSFQTLGIIGTAAALFWPGEKQPLHLTKRGQNLVGLGNFLYGAAAFARNVALNFALREAEERISADVLEVPYENAPANYYEKIAITSSIAAFSLYSASALSTVWGLLESRDNETPNIETNNFFWGFIPYGDKGITLHFDVYLR